MAWNYKNKSNTSIPETDFVFSDGSDFLFSDGTDFVFNEAVTEILWRTPTKSSTSYTYATKN